MSTVKEIVTYFERVVPPEMKMDFDNVGLLVGINDTEVKTALVALDVTDGVIDEAIACGAQMILSHHPVFFELKQVNDGSPAGRKVTKLLQNGISAFCQHTNLDSVSGGVNDALAATLSVSVKGRLVNQISGGGVEYGMGRYGELANPISLEEFMIFVKSSLCAGGIRYYDAGRLVKKVALCGGSGGEYVETAAKLGCDTLVTADVKYHQFLAAKELGINLLDAGHFCTENVVVPVIADMLKKAFPDVNVLISRTHTQTVRFF
jgi:dinuclear metal center YbgI/SA1388 family protein